MSQVTYGQPSVAMRRWVARGRGERSSAVGIAERVEHEALTSASCRVRDPVAATVTLSPRLPRREHHGHGGLSMVTAPSCSPRRRTRSEPDRRHLPLREPHVSQELRKGEVPTPSRALETAGLGEGVGRTCCRCVRRARRCGQGRDDPAVHGAPQSPRSPGGCVGEAERDRAWAVVRPASAHPGRDRPVRPILVQPRRGRTGHGVLLTAGVPRVPPSSPGIRAQPELRRQSPT